MNTAASDSDRSNPSFTVTGGESGCAAAAGADPAAGASAAPVVGAAGATAAGGALPLPEPPGEEAAGAVAAGAPQPAIASAARPTSACKLARQRPGTSVRRAPVVARPCFTAHPL